LGMDWNELFKYKVDKDTPLPTGEPVDDLAAEEEAVSQSSAPAHRKNGS
jgi:hypothetical protein